MIGSSLSHFRITAKLGEGGMGEVYRATDTKLGRQVAIKVLPQAVANDPERLARFEREAKVLASLNHPHIAAIYSIESAVPSGQPEARLAPQEEGKATLGKLPAGPGTGGASLGEAPEDLEALVDAGDRGAERPHPAAEGSDYQHRPIHFLVMELVEGEDLTSRIGDGPMDRDDFLGLGLQMAEALDAAHERGIIHRDLKPANIKITPTGQVKILDFGLAKRQAGLVEPALASSAETLDHLTQENQIVGTIPYMSPEQIRAGTLDQRSDLFSLGVIFFEMLGGKRPFEGDSQLDLIFSILKEQPPDLRRLHPELDAELVALILHCIEKEPNSRIGSAFELRHRLQKLHEKRSDNASKRTAETESSASKRRRALDPRAVAVLPLTILGGSDDADFLATGLHNDLITELSRIQGLTIISRASVMGYLDTQKSPPEIGRELNVGTLIQGTMQNVGNRVRVTAQLIDAIEDVQRWAERYDRELSTETLFDLQSEVTRKIVDSLQSELAPTLDIPRGKPLTHDMEAYRLVTLGRLQVERRTENGCRRAIEHFRSAVERDPGYPPAWAGLGEALAISVWYGYGEPGDRLQRAHRAALRAVELDPESAEAHGALAAYLGAVRNGPEAVQQLELAVRLQPSYWQAHNLLSYLHHLNGQARRSLDAAKRAVEINPLSAEAVNHLSLSLLTIGEPESALTEARRAGELSPGWTTATFYEALALLELGRHDEATELLAGLTVEWAGLGAQATLALTHLAAGNEPLVRQVLAEMDADIDAFAVGLVHLGLGDIEAAFQGFSEAAELTDWACLAVHHLYPDIWTSVHNDPRYPELVRRAFESHNFEPPEGTLHD